MDDLITKGPLTFTLVQGSLLHYEAEREEATATLKLFIEDPAGENISDVLREIRKQTERVAKAEACIKVLQRFLTIVPPHTSNAIN